MSNNTGRIPSNGHRIRGRSSESFIDAREVLSKLELKGDEVFMDAGCGDGHVSFLAREVLDDDALIYALDNYEPSIEDLERDVKARGITNIIPIQGDIAGDSSLDDDSVDVSLMINVFHHFTENSDAAIAELKRVTKPGGRIAVMDYKKMDTGYGPPLKFKRSPEELKEMFTKHGLEMVQLDTEVGEDLEGGVKSHYMIVFQKVSS
jgi:cyclopropane fatty-acyl-phospholipid synthase-like methyltransferase